MSGDLRPYLARIGYGGPDPAPTLACLVALHRAHATSIPFENLDIQLGIPVRLEIAHLWDKFVGRRRGGYCFEHNTLFEHVLHRVGFDVFAAEGRVREGAAGVRPRTHMVLVATVEGRRWLCDVGFGGDGLLEPASLDGRPLVDATGEYRVAIEGAQLVLQRRDRAAAVVKANDAPWTDLYAFVPEMRYPIDFEVGNWFTSTYPSSPFVTALTAQRRTPDERHVLRNLTYTVRRGGETRTREVARADLVPLLRDVFGIELPTSARFSAVDR